MTSLSWPPLIQALQDPARYPQPVRSVQVLETHISWVLLAGEFAYKIKKPVDLGFLDFSTQERRRHFCHEELRLNRRYAPKLYLGVIGLTGTPADPRLDGSGAPFEYAVQMRQFAGEDRLDHVLARGELLPDQIDDLAAEVARQHTAAAVAGEEQSFGRPEAVRLPVDVNFEQMRRRVRDPAQQARLDRLAAWSEREWTGRKKDFQQRKSQGRIRECHGDLHLANMVLLAGRATLFDCLEFSEPLRWIDVLSDLAFAVMDLEDRRQPAFAQRLLNAYLEHAGDYSGLSVLPYYLTYRALVRATVATIRAGQPAATDVDRSRAWQEFDEYVTLAERYTQPKQPALYITQGLSGSGKTHFTQSLLERIGAVRVRSDVERKRLAGMEPASPTAAENLPKMYSATAHEATYQRLAEVAGQILAAGFPAIVDATFLKRADRRTFQDLAERLHVPLVVLEFQADRETLLRRVQERRAAGRDASDATAEVLDLQLRELEPLQPDERQRMLSIDASATSHPSALAAAVALAGLPAHTTEN